MVTENSQLKHLKGAFQDRSFSFKKTKRNCRIQFKSRVKLGYGASYWPRIKIIKFEHEILA